MPLKMCSDGNKKNWRKQKHSKVTEQKKSFKYFTTLHAKVKAQFIYSNAVYANYSMLENVGLFSTTASIIKGKMGNHKPQF